MGRYGGQLQILCWTHNGSEGGSTHGGRGIGGVRVFGGMGRGEEVLGVSSIKCAVQGLHCEVKSMDESSLVPRPLPPPEERGLGTRLE